MHPKHRLLLIKTVSTIGLILMAALPVEASETDRAVAELLGQGTDAEAKRRKEQETASTTPPSSDRPLYEADPRRRERADVSTTGDVLNSSEEGPNNLPSVPVVLNDGSFETGTGGLPGDINLPDILGGDSTGGFETGSGGIPQEVWEIIQSQTGIEIGDSSIEDIWNVIATGYELPDYGSIFGNNDDVFGGYGGGVILNATNTGGSTPPISGGSTPSILSGGSLPPLPGGSTPPIAGGGGSTPPVSGGGGTLPTVFGGGSSTPTSSGGTSTGFNPFKWVKEWIGKNLKTPIMRVFGISGKTTRTPFQNEAMGTLTRNSIVQRRDQANMFSQELARMMAAPKLGVEGEAWMTAESEASMNVLGAGMDQVNEAVQLSDSAQTLTSTQDVAKAVAKISGHNAQTIGAALQLQTQSQAALLQLQQMTAASIELEANISEALDETNRRERLERDSIFYSNAGETLYLRGVWNPPTPAKP